MTYFHFFQHTNLSLMPPTPPVNFGAEGVTPTGLVIPSIQRNAVTHQGEI